MTVIRVVGVGDDGWRSSGSGTWTQSVDEMDGKTEVTLYIVYAPERTEDLLEGECTSTLKGGVLALHEGPASTLWQSALSSSSNVDSLVSSL